MPALSFTLNQIAAALLGAGAYIYATQRGQWSACAIVCGCLIQRSSPDPYAALGAVAQVLIDYEAQQAAQDLVPTPAARAAYKAAWASSEGQPVPARFAAAEAAAAATESAEWPSTIRTEQDNARTMQRLRSITGRPSAAEAASEHRCEMCDEPCDEKHSRCKECRKIDKENEHDARAEEWAGRKYGRHHDQF
jgi:hypothetical protein